jgi:hypothetical protein
MAEEEERQRKRNWKCVAGHVDSKNKAAFFDIIKREN